MNRRRPRPPGRTHATLGAWCPRRAPVSPLYESFFFASPHPKSAARARAPRTARGGRGGSGARGSAAGQRKCPRRPPPPLQPAPAPRPAATLAGRAPRATGGGGGRCGPGCPNEPTMPGRQNKRDPLRLLPGLSLTLSGSRAGSRADRGRAPRGPEPRAPRLVPADPGLSSPPTSARPPHRRKACRTPVCSDSWSPGIRPYCPRGAPRARPRSPAAPARVPTGLQEQAGGA